MPRHFRWLRLQRLQQRALERLRTGAPFVRRLARQRRNTASKAAGSSGRRDGRWLAYVSDDGGAREVYVTSIPDGTTRRQVSRGGGEEPRFSRSGTELFFVSGGALTVVPVLRGPSFEVGAPRALFPVEGYAHAANRQQYDVAPGDDRFLMIKMPPAPPVPPMVMAEHWFTELLAKLKP